jgi:hypothetical protein
MCAIVLSNTGGAIVKKKKSKQQTIKKIRRVNPDIYVLINPLVRGRLHAVAAKASIRLKRIGNEQYCYLNWRDGNKVRSFYLGRNRGKTMKN